MVYYNYHQSINEYSPSMTGSQTLEQSHNFQGCQ